MGLAPNACGGAGPGRGRIPRQSGLSSQGSRMKPVTAPARTALGRPTDPDWRERSGRLFEEFEGQAKAMVRRAFRGAFSPDELDDIYAGAWVGTLRALANRQAGLADDEIRSYVLTAVANQAGKEIRRRKRKPTAPLELVGGGRRSDAALRRSSRRAPSRAASTRDVLASLPPRRRAVMLLRYGWGLEPSQVCGLIKGLSPRAYRKEITRGVDELTERMRAVERGSWCADREPVLKVFAAGLADDEQERQARAHLAHCRHCSEFVGRLSGHLHDLGGAVAAVGAIDAHRRPRRRSAIGSPISATAPRARRPRRIHGVDSGEGSRRGRRRARSRRCGSRGAGEARRARHSREDRRSPARAAGWRRRPASPRASRRSASAATQDDGPAGHGASASRADRRIIRAEAARGRCTCRRCRRRSATSRSRPAGAAAVVRTPMPTAPSDRGRARARARSGGDRAGRADGGAPPRRRPSRSSASRRRRSRRRAPSRARRIELGVERRRQPGEPSNVRQEFGP